MKQKTIIWVWRGVLALGSISILGWIFFQNLVPTGVLVLKYKKNSPSSQISSLHPEKRVIDIKEDVDSQRIFSDPVYFDVKIPREFDTVTVDMAWQNLSQPILELGARKFRNSWGFVLKPLQNKIIDSLNWQCDRYEEAIFCQKKKNYSNLSEFFANPKGKIISYNYNFPENLEHDAMNVNTNIDDYDYLVAIYKSPEDLGGGWFRRSITYNWSDFELYINEISFLVSAPELDKGHGQIVFGDISVVLKRDQLDWNGFLEYIKNQARRLKK